VTDLLTVSQPSDGPLTLTFRGALGGSAAGAIWDRAIEAARGSGADVVLDLEQVTECDGVGLALITKADQLVRTAGRELSFTGASDELGELIRMARLEP
jgi:anti-anti-sigma regulatory factor